MAIEDELREEIRDLQAKLEGGGSSDELAAQRRQFDQAWATLTAERDQLRTRVAALESQVATLSKVSAPPPESRAPVEAPPPIKPAAPPKGSGA